MKAGRTGWWSEQHVIYHGVQAPSAPWRKLIGLWIDAHDPARDRFAGQFGNVTLWQELARAQERL